MKNIKKYYPVLKALLKAKGKKRGIILKNADPHLLKLLTEAVFNILKGNVPMSRAHYSKLSPHKRTLIQLAKRPNDLKFARSTFLRKKGGAILPLILPALLSLATSFING